MASHTTAKPITCPQKEPKVSNESSNLGIYQQTRTPWTVTSSQTGSKAQTAMPTQPRVRHSPQMHPHPLPPSSTTPHSERTQCQKDGITKPFSAHASQQQPPQAHNKTVTIWQQNINKPPACQHNLISSTKLAKEGIDIVAFQEPAINNFRVMIASRDWTLVYPTTHRRNLSKTRSLFLIRNNLMTDNWKQIDFPSSDIIVIQLNSEWGVLTIYNIYNDCEGSDTIHQLDSFNHNLKSHTSHPAQVKRSILWLGDFNCHHPHWDNPTDTRLFTKATINKAEILISTLAEAGLDLALPAGILTHMHNVTK